MAQANITKPNPQATDFSFRKNQIKWIAKECHSLRRRGLPTIKAVNQAQLNNAIQVKAYHKRITAVILRLGYIWTI